MDTIFKPASTLTIDTVQQEYERMLPLFLDPAGASLSISFHEVRHFDSAGLALLIEAKRMSKKYNKILKIEGLPDKVYALAKFCGVETVLTDGRLDDKQ
ncbi:STAS domain-containing protein [Legionella londiniensis]|uniref:Anti-anti-sigma factor n=1 Tax=Legionella londiniensis TaxID=45068 RepID=A0A0W0VKU2_9GAMM|nr:STAS domain-containing protein [Legionella londiniensis]KTD20715.1 anti-anti-sigma factor [Legionella londiniensis]STX92812.1 anti-anti-sigma factor [Legionella londiniensis]